jgi:hypothetical protein
VAKQGKPMDKLVERIFFSLAICLSDRFFVWINHRKITKISINWWREHAVYKACLFFRI